MSGVSNYDTLRYGRDWRRGADWTGPDELENGHFLLDVCLMVFLTPEQRHEYANEQKLNGCHLDFLSEKEMACVLGASSRQKVWEYFGIGNGDYSMVPELVGEGMVSVYGKSAPATFADEEDD